MRMYNRFLWGSTALTLLTLWITGYVPSHDTKTQGHLESVAPTATTATSASTAALANAAPTTGAARHPGDIKPVHVLGMRKFPYPYRAMLAISSDADHQTIRKFVIVHEFLNTTAETPMGKGLGLDFSDSVFMYNGSNLPSPVDDGGVPLSQMMTYFQGVSSQPKDAALINHYIHAGWIDTLHTYGDFSQRNQGQTKFKRRLAVQAIQALAQNHDNITVWTDHGNASNVDNFGSYGVDPFFNYQQGANPKSPYHHTDLLIKYGAHFVWGGNWSAVFGHSSMIYPINLPDGHRIWGFYRYTSTGQARSGQVLWVWDPKDVAQELTLPHLKEIEQQHQYAIIAQHLEGSNNPLPLSNGAISALRLLARQYDAGNILVARTSRLLTYNVSQQFLRYRVTHDAQGRAVIHILRVDDKVCGSHIPSLNEVRGITFYTTDPRNTVLEIGNHPVPQSLVQYNQTDGVSKSIGIRWFPSNTKNYALTH